MEKRFFMNVCMHDYAKEHRRHGEVRFHNVGVQG